MPEMRSEMDFNWRSESNPLCPREHEFHAMGKKAHTYTQKRTTISFGILDETSFIRLATLN